GHAGRQEPSAMHESRSTEPNHIECDDISSARARVIIIMNRSLQLLQPQLFSRSPFDDKITLEIVMLKSNNPRINGIFSMAMNTKTTISVIAILAMAI